VLGDARRIGIWRSGVDGDGVTPIVCKCGAPMVWLKTREGRSMPTDWSEDIKLGDTFDLTKHKSHFSSCRFAKEFRKK
jgi:hypothetical protein